MCKLNSQINKGAGEICVTLLKLYNNNSQTFIFDDKDVADVSKNRLKNCSFPTYY